MGYLLLNMNLKGLNMEIANFVISFIVLLFTIATFVFTFVINSYHFDIGDISILKDKGHLLLKFTFVNDSPKAIKISKVKFLDNNGHIIKPLNFDPYNFDKELMNQKAKKWDLEHAQFDMAGEIMSMPLSSANPYKLPPNMNYDFCKTIDLPTVLKSDSTLAFSFYLDKCPEKVEVEFNRKIMVGIRWLFIPMFTKSFSVNYTHKGEIQNSNYQIDD